MKKQHEPVEIFKHHHKKQIHKRMKNSILQ